eukprot:1960394-Prymnesium_polylepis.1
MPGCGARRQRLLQPQAVTGGWSRGTRGGRLDHGNSTTCVSCALRTASLLLASFVASAESGTSASPPASDDRMSSSWHSRSLEARSQSESVSSDERQKARRPVPTW